MKRLLVSIGLITLSLMAGCKHKEEVVEENPVYGVTTPLKKDSSVTRDYVCQIHAFRRIEVRSLESGYLQKIYVDEGKRVAKGQMMFKVMPPLYQAELKGAEAEAKAAEIEYQNTKFLADQDIVSKSELAINKAKLDRAKASLTLAKTHLAFTDLRAPFNGLVDHLEAREGSLLEEGDLLTTLTDTSKMWVYFNVSEAQYLNFMSHKNQENLRQVKLRMANGEIFPYSGKVETIEGEFDHETGNIEMRATFPNPQGLLRHGETGSILMNQPYKGALIIPQSATFEILDKKFVFIVDKNNVVKQRAIEVAEEMPYLYILKSGVAANEHILLEGLRKVRNDQKIEVKVLPTQKVYSDLELHAE